MGVVFPELYEYLQSPMGVVKDMCWGVITNLALMKSSSKNVLLRANPNSTAVLVAPWRAGQGMAEAKGEKLVSKGGGKKFSLFLTHSICSWVFADVLAHSRILFFLNRNI